MIGSGKIIAVLRRSGFGEAFTNKRASRSEHLPSDLIQFVGDFISAT
jgi:hypothetical protein